MEERDVAGEILINDGGNVVPLDPPVVHAVRQAYEVAGESVAAHVGALPSRLCGDLLVQRLEKRTAVAGAAGVVFPVRAREEERLVDRRRCLPRVEGPKVFMIGELDVPEPLASFARVGDVNGQPRVPAAVGAANKENAGRAVSRAQLS
jgi:hypothetical protein